MNSVETALLENVDKSGSLFIFPTDVAASRWADHLLRLKARLQARLHRNTGNGAFNGVTVAMEKFIAWDTFKQNSIRSKVLNRKSVPAVLRKMFIAGLIRENATLCAREEEPVFTSLIQSAWAQQADSYAGWLAGFLPQLGIWFRQATGLPIAQIKEDSVLKLRNNFSGDDRDMFTLALRYTQFLEKNGLFEPVWETPPFEDTGMECFIFFPESLSDFGEYRELLAASCHVKTIQADSGSFAADNVNFAADSEARDSAPFKEGAPSREGDVFFYTNARSEITEAALYIIALHENQNVPWDGISVSIPDTGNYGPYVFREFDNRNIPYVKQSGKPLASYPGGQLFAAIAGCSSEDFSFASITALLSNRHLPWKEEEKIQALIQFGIDNNCICSWTEEASSLEGVPSKEDGGKEKKIKGINPSVPHSFGHVRASTAATSLRSSINVWEDAFENHADNYAWLYTFFKKLTLMINAMRYADSFSAIRKHYFAFRASFFDMEKCLDETDLVLSRCITELGYLVEIENSYPDARVPDPYAFFTDYLEEISYLAQQSSSGVAILPYRTAAPAPFDCHIILGANQDSLSAVFSFLSFLPRSKREKLGIGDNDASQAFITLHRFNSRLPAAFFCSEQTFSNYAIPHSALKAEIKPRQRYRDDPELGAKFAPDLYHEESRLYTSLHFPGQGQEGLPAPSKIHSNQKQGFSEWLIRRKCANTEGNTASDSETSHPLVEHIRNRFLYKGNDKELEGKYGISSSSLELYFKCPLQFIFSRVLKLKNVEIETSLMANETAGIVYHKIINLFLEELKEKGEVIAPPFLEGGLSYILPKSYSDKLKEKTDIVFNSFPFLSDEDNKPAMSMLTARLLRAEKELFFTQLENFLIKFISFFSGFSVVASEGKYTLNKKFYYLNGYIDCILENKREGSENQGSLVIVDFKTKYMPALQDCIDLEELTDFQLPMYIRLAENEFGKKAGTALFFSILDAVPQVLFGVIQDVINGEVIPWKEQNRIMHGSGEYERIMGEFDKKAEQFAAEIFNGNFAFSPSHWELCQKCGYNRVCRTLYKVFQGEKQWTQTKKK
jgi:hypothetical protein